MTRSVKRKKVLPKCEAQFEIRPIPKVGLKRREQQRSIDTRVTIIRAALAEFAEKGFEAASIRSIAQRTGLQHPLITYHYRTKEILWQAVAEHLFAEIRQNIPPVNSALSARDYVRERVRNLFRFTMDYPDFHQFLLRENRPNNPRLSWIIERFLRPALRDILPKIEEAQRTGDLPPSDPILVHYMLIGMTSVLSSLGSEIKEIARIEPDAPDVVDAYWKLIEMTVFGRSGCVDRP
jgi:TetR/AcrR family transcriptional regulator